MWSVTTKIRQIIERGPYSVFAARFFSWIGINMSGAGVIIIFVILLILLLIFWAWSAQGWGWGNQNNGNYQNQAAVQNPCANSCGQWGSAGVIIIVVIFIILIAAAFFWSRGAGAGYGRGGAWYGN